MEDADHGRCRPHAVDLLSGDSDSDDGGRNDLGTGTVAVALGGWLVAPRKIPNTVHGGLVMDLAEMRTDCFYCESSADVAQAAVSEQQPLVGMGCALCKDVAMMVGP